MAGGFSAWPADGAVVHAQVWRPDLVIYERMAPFGLLAAAVLGVPDLVDNSPWRDIASPSMVGTGRDGWPMRPVPYGTVSIALGAVGAW